MLRMLLSSFGSASLLCALLTHCAPPAPKPLDTQAIPSASTSAEPLYVSNFPLVADAGADGADAQGSK